MLKIATTRNDANLDLCGSSGKSTSMDLQAPTPQTEGRGGVVRGLRHLTVHIFAKLRSPERRGQGAVVVLLEGVHDVKILCLQEQHHPLKMDAKYPHLTL